MVELCTALLFVAVYDAFYVANTHMGFADLLADWPLLMSHLFLVGALIVCSVMDIEHYIIDLRIVYVIIPVGIVGWMLACQDGKEYLWPAINSAFFAGSIGAMLGEGLRRLLTLFLGEESPGNEEEFSPEQASSGGDKQNAIRWDIILVLILTALTAAEILWPAFGWGGEDLHPVRLGLYVLWVFIGIVAGCVPKRSSDDNIIEAIEDEKGQSRHRAFTELLALLPAAAGFAAGVVIVKLSPPAAQTVNGWLALSVGNHLPLAGLNIAITSLLIATAFGWLVRIVFTLLLGKEAMGVGDIYVLAAIAAVAGPIVSILGFFLGSIIGVAGMFVLLLWKTTRALSYVPWIAIGSLVVILFHDPLVDYLKPAAESVLWLLQEL